MSKDNARVAMRKMRNLLPPRKMIPAQSMGKHDGWSGAGALVVDFGARVLNETARNGSISDFRRLPLLRFPAGRYQHATGGEACEFREIATRNHEDQHCSPKGAGPGMALGAAIAPTRKQGIDF